ncbi:hypothetical protein BD410DRAFT_702822, partial [Rickenella mellea]
SLMLWIAHHVFHIPHVLGYIDDDFSFDRTDNMTYYKPYDTYLPSGQTALLTLWDRIGLPHDRKKQVFGTSLTIIGFLIDTDTMQVSMPLEKKAELVAAIRAFVNVSPKNRRRPLKEFLRLAGWCNWGLNVSPHLKPGLASLYEKTAGKSNLHAPCMVNEQIVRDLTWFADHFQASDGIFFFDSIAWDA